MGRSWLQSSLGLGVVTASSVGTVTSGVGVVTGVQTTTRGQGEGGRSRGGAAQGVANN